MVAEYAKLQSNMEHPKRTVFVEDPTVMAHGPKHSISSLLVLDLLVGKEVQHTYPRVLDPKIQQVFCSPEKQRIKKFGEISDSVFPSLFSLIKWDADIFPESRQGVERRNPQESEKGANVFQLILYGSASETPSRSGSYISDSPM